MIWFWFLVHMCKMIISPAIFFIFFKFRFFLVFSPLKTQNQNFEKMKKFAGDIIILYMCTKNQNDIMHGSWDTKWHSNKRAKNGMKLPISVCHTLYLRNSRSCHRDFVTQIMISPGVVLYFFKKCSIVNIKIILFLSALLNSFFLINIWFSSSSVNAKKKFWVVPHLHMCVIFCSHLRIVKMVHIENIIITSIN